MLAIVKENSKDNYVIKDIEKPTLRDDDVLIKVHSVGICGTDIPILSGVREVPYPLIPGHEFSGDIVELGKGAKKFKIGDRVTPSIVIGCGVCSYCREGNEVLCDNIEETGIHVNGAFAEYVRVPEKVVHLLPESMSYDVGASIDPIASAYRPIKKAKINCKDTVLVFGSGPIGLYTVQLAKCEGASNIIVVGVKGDERRLELAKELGADYSINMDEDSLIEKVKEYNNGKLVDVAIDATGSEKVFPLCIDLVKGAGKIILVGINHAPATANIEKVVRKEINIMGSICYTYNDYKECIELVENKRVKVLPLISHRFKLFEMGEAIEKINMKQTIKVMLEI
ncbi:MAG: zinc-dependent alcohol dehydrogenase [Filifactoraceae bacterium]